MLSTGDTLYIQRQERIETERMGKDKPIKYQEKAKIQNTISDEKELRANSVIKNKEGCFISCILVKGTIE